MVPSRPAPVETVAELSDSAVAALNRMLSSPMLAKSPRQRELLNYLARHSFAGQSERLKGYAIGVDVFGRGPDFDPAVDAIVRVEIGRLRSRLREYYEGAGRDDPIRFELPRGRNLLIYRSRDSEAASGGSTQKGDSAAAAVPVLAVLPLTHIGQDASKDYLNDGIVDGLIHELSRLSGMRVISRMSTFTYRGTSKGSREIARELGAGYVLFGSAQYAGERLRLTVQMVHGESDKTIWSERFDADFEAIFSLQDKLAESVVRALQIQLAPAELNAFGHDRTTNIQAHNHFLLGVASFSKGAPNFVIDAKDQFTRAITADPGYAAAHAWLARAKLNLWMMNRSTDAGLRDEALKHAERAVELDPELAYAQSILGWVHLWFKRADEAILHCSRAVAMAPDNPESLNSLSMALSFSGDGEWGLYYIQKALKLNPVPSPIYQFTLAAAYIVLEDYDKALHALRLGARIGPAFMPNQIQLTLMYALLNMDEEMKAQRTLMLAMLGGDLSRKPRQPWTTPNLENFYEDIGLRIGI